MSIFRRLERLLYPPRCLACREFCDTTLCATCAAKLTRLDNPRITADDFVVYAPLVYDDIGKQLMHNLKFYGLHAVSAFLAEEMANAVRSIMPADALITWVPVSLQRARERGYSQSQLLAKGVAMQLKLPAKRLLDKTRHTAAQSQSRNADERAQNVKDAYRVVGDTTDKIILLIDDVWTTGATMTECVHILRNAGTKDVIVLTAMYAQRKS